MIYYGPLVSSLPLLFLLLLLQLIYDYQRVSRLQTVMKHEVGMYKRHFLFITLFCSSKKRKLEKKTKFSRTVTVRKQVSSFEWRFGVFFFFFFFFSFFFFFLLSVVSYCFIRLH